MENKYKLVAPDVDRLLRYCENLFPSEYGNVIDFMHIYDDEMLILEDMIRVQYKSV